MGVGVAVGVIVVVGVGMRVAEAVSQSNLAAVLTTVAQEFEATRSAPRSKLVFQKLHRVKVQRLKAGPSTLR